MENQVTTELKEKRKYNRIESDASKLMELASAKGFKVKDVAFKMDCSTVTAKKLLVDPMNCTGYDRKKLAEIFEVPVHYISELID